MQLSYGYLDYGVLFRVVTMPVPMEALTTTQFNTSRVFELTDLDLLPLLLGPP